MAWQLYDDMFRHRADGPHALAKDAQRSVARWVLFLRTDLEYSWPNYDFRQSGTSLDRFLADLFTAGRWSKKKHGDWENFLGAGDFEVWPFLKKPMKSLPGGATNNSQIYYQGLFSHPRVLGRNLPFATRFGRKAVHFFANSLINSEVAEKPRH
jgi:hypothetical protein